MTATNIAPWLMLMSLLLTTHGCVQKNLTLWDLSAGRETTLQEILPKLRDTNLVLVGEQHDSPDHHAAQLRVIQSLHDTQKPMAVALEMFEHHNQSVLDRWVSGEMDEAAFIPHFEANWGRNWSLYRQIFLYCRNNRIPMVGINVPREITSQVAQNGFASLNRAQVDLLPQVTCRVDPEYMKLMRQAHGHGTGDEGFTRFCEAQLVWDTAMAVYSLEYLKKHPDSTVVLLAGSVHAWKKGIPSKVQEQNPDTRLQILLPDTPGRFEKGAVTREDADYLILAR
jgi:uncharacterized iron-regulated protein